MINRDELDDWMRERDLMLITREQFADLTRQLALARHTATRLEGVRLRVLDHLKECDEGSLRSDIVRNLMP